MEFWEPKPPRTLWDTPGLLRDCFTFFLYFSQHPLPKNLPSCVLTEGIRDTTFHARTKHRATLNLIQSSSRDLQFSNYENRTTSLHDLTCSKLSTTDTAGRIAIQGIYPTVALERNCSSCKQHNLQW